METPIVNETHVRRSIAEPDDFALELVEGATAPEPPALPSWEATVVAAPRRSIA